ncbi:hypothetical protein AWQ21_05365 [Picosynechococcus sp. PCC 7003]|uniref:regulatory protein SipA n=1 Tax=Picosynechococcus sp. PCC 7003 TaxID=374981 RepID=UPI00081045FC|nr:DUF3148 domain-containing protein [Picosynechococcus sp. PCC 7003]ANV83859.1 hypothetical protein AWQ21_05365 [Picosynechococcus sp. PCC 7003]
MAEFKQGAQVKLAQLPPFLKTADPMPMLRPADLLAVGEVGTLGDRRPGGYWVVKFERGSFLLEETYLTVAAEAE